MITIRDQHREGQIEQERRRRGHATLSKTLMELVTERLVELDCERKQQARQTSSASSEESEPRAA